MINLEVTLQELETILKHLGQGAFDTVAPLIAKIHGQAIPQTQPKEEKTE